jgi:hypothetical protein
MSQNAIHITAAVCSSIGPAFVHHPYIRCTSGQGPGRCFANAFAAGWSAAPLCDALPEIWIIYGQNRTLFAGSQTRRPLRTQHCCGLRNYIKFVRTADSSLWSSDGAIKESLDRLDTIGFRHGVRLPWRTRSTCSLYTDATEQRPSTTSCPAAKRLTTQGTGLW